MRLPFGAIHAIIVRIPVKGGIFTATIKDIAARSGVSIATVSKHINGIPVKEANRRRIDAAIQELGYQVNAAARALKTRRSMTIGILLDSLSNLFYTSVISEMEEILLLNGYTALLFETKDLPQRAQQGLELFSAKSVDGVFYFASHCLTEILRSCRRLQIPLVVVDSISPDCGDYPECADVDFVMTENAQGAFSAVSSLLDKGHRGIAVITGTELHFSANERLRGYQNALRSQGLPIREKWVCRDEYNIDGGYRCIKRLLAAPDERPTALLICNYFMAMGAIMALNEENVRVPEELSIISFDEIEWTRAVKPRLSTVNQQADRIAETAVNRLLARIGGETAAGQAFLIPTRQVERESVLPIHP